MAGSFYSQRVRNLPRSDCYVSGSQDLTKVSVLLSLLRGDVPGVDFAPDLRASVFATRLGLHRAQAKEDAAGRDVNGNQNSARPWHQMGFAALSFSSCSGIQLTPSFNRGVRL